jgi:hypothetical protein
MYNVVTNSILLLNDIHAWHVREKKKKFQLTKDTKLLALLPSRLDNKMFWFAILLTYGIAILYTMHPHSSSLCVAAF